jgi:hypothetical protein
MTIVPVEFELGVSEAIAVSLTMIHGRIETHHHHHINNNTQIIHNIRYIHIFDIAPEFFFFLHIGHDVEHIVTFFDSSFKSCSRSRLVVDEEHERVERVWSRASRWCGSSFSGAELAGKAVTKKNEAHMALTTLGNLSQENDFKAIEKKLGVATKAGLAALKSAQEGFDEPQSKL